MAKFTILLEKEREGGYSVHVPVLPGCHTQGETKKEALKNAEDAIRGYLESLQKDGVRLNSLNAPVKIELATVSVSTTPT